MQWFKNMKRQLKVQNILYKHESLCVSNWARVECLCSRMEDRVGREEPGVTWDNPLPLAHSPSTAGSGFWLHKSSSEKENRPLWIISWIYKQNECIYFLFPRTEAIERKWILRGWLTLQPPQKLLLYSVLINTPKATTCVCLPKSLCLAFLERKV
jgi:hypothetical protein